MRSQEINVYREIQKSTEMSMKAIEIISDKVYDDQLALQISRQGLKYSEIHDRACSKLLQYRTEPVQPNRLTELMLSGAIHYNTLLNTSTGHIAELMIKGSNQGILSMNRVLNHNEEAGDQPIKLAKELIEFESKNVERLKKYL